MKKDDSADGVASQQTSLETNYGSHSGLDDPLKYQNPPGTSVSSSKGLSLHTPFDSSDDDNFTNDTTRDETTTTLPQLPLSPVADTPIVDTDKWQTLASVAGNVLEWFDFAIFGYLSDILGEVFFPPSTTSSSDDNTATKQQTMESFFVFGLAFLMRPIGGLLFGYIGDYYGRKKALVISIFTMAFPTFLMGTLPGYSSVGRWAIFFLVVVRLLQGLSVGGQLISSLVYLLENKDPNHWGFYGSFTMAAAIL